MRRLGALCREALRSALSQPISGVLTVVMVAGMCVAVLLTTGRTAAAEEAALAQIDAAGTRTLTIRGGDGAGLDTGLIDRLRRVDAVAEVTAFGPITDVRNAALDGGPAVASRPVHGDLRGPWTTATPTNEATANQAKASASALGDLPLRAYASRRAAETLGLVDGTGSVVDDGGGALVIAGPLTVPDYLEVLEPLVVVPGSASAGSGEPAPVAMVVVLVTEPHLVAAVADTVVPLLGAQDPRQVTVETSQDLAEVRAAVQGELGAYGRGTVLGILAVAGLLVGANLYGLVMMRRKDFGRRRALGASQGLIVTILLVQVAILGLLGSVLGIVGAIAGLSVTGSPLPAVEFDLAVGVAATLTAVVAALIPALVAARREPLYELRTP